MNTLKSQDNWRENQNKMPVRKDKQEFPAASKEEQIKSRSDVIQKLIKEKQREKEHSQEKEKQQREAKEKLKNSFRIPKKKPDVEKLIESLFDDTETKNKEDLPDVSKKKDKSKPDADSSGSKNTSNLSSSHKEKSHLSSKNDFSDKDRNSSDKHSSSTHNHHHKSHSHHHKSSSSYSSGKKAEHISGLPSEKSSSVSKDHKHRSSSEIKSSYKSQGTEHLGKSSSGAKHNTTHSSSSKSHISPSSKEKESLSSKPELKSSPYSSLIDASSPRSTGLQTSASDQLPVVLNKHHLHPIVERQASAGLSEKEKILARLQAIKQRTLEAIHKENSGKGRRAKGEKSQRKSKTEVKHDDKTKSVEIVRDIASSDEEEEGNNGVPSALDIMLSERTAKLEKEKIARMAKQAWERATKKETGDSDKEVKVKKRHKSSRREGTSSHSKPNKDDRKSHHKSKDHSLSSHHESRKLSPKPKKHIVRHSVQSAAPPMDFKALLEMAEKKQKEPPKLVTAIPKKKKEEDKRPLTQEEKDRIERKNSKEYQDWLKFGGKPPKNDISDEEDLPTHSSNKNGDKKSVSQYSASVDKQKTLSGSSKQSFNGNSNNLRNITVNENVLVCGPAASSDDEASLDRSGNPFDRIMSTIHKKRPAPQPRAAIPVKKMHLDDLEEEDYESDMDDFIDDGEDEEPDYSKEIKKLFGYDKSKYKYERDDDLSDMEADYSTVMKEEKLSAKLGLQEDLEDIRREQEELKRKAMLKKRK